MANGEDLFFGQIAIQKQYITLEQLDECLRTQKKMHPPHRIGEILVEKGYLTQEKLEDTILSQKKQNKKDDFSIGDFDDEVLEKNILTKGFASKKHIREAKRAQEPRCLEEPCRAWRHARAAGLRRQPARRLVRAGAPGSLPEAGKFPHPEASR